MNTEEQIIYKGIQALEEKTALKGRWFASLKDKTLQGRLEIKTGQQKKVFPAIIKREIKNTNLVNFLQLKEKAPGFIIIAEIIYPAIREQLRKMELNFLDTAGNCYIKRDDWMFLIEGFKPEIPVPLNKDRAFTKTGLLLVFHFLNDEKYLNVTYRQMAMDYDVALGNITNIVNSLKTQGYLVKLNNGLKLVRKKELLDEWIGAYEQKLKPTMLIGNFRFLNGQDKEWEKIPLKNTETQWGGEPAANLLTGYLKPGKLILYTQENKPNLIKNYRLVPDEKGILALYRKFWHFDITADTVPIILIYADLINTADPRNIETAKRLYDGFLKDQF